MKLFLAEWAVGVFAGLLALFMVVAPVIHAQAKQRSEDYRARGHATGNWDEPERSFPRPRNVALALLAYGVAIAVYVIATMGGN